MQYHYYVQGFIYNLLKGSKFDYIHDKQGYKFFCFSNIFPVTKTIQKNDLRKLIISSPDIEFIIFLSMIFQSLNSQVKIGNMKFVIDTRC